MQAAVAWGYPTLTAWECEHPVTRGRVIAWHLERSIRDGYEAEKQEEKAEADAKNKVGKKASFKANDAYKFGESLRRQRAAKMKGN